MLGTSLSYHPHPFCPTSFDDIQDDDVNRLAQGIRDRILVENSLVMETFQFNDNFPTAASTDLKPAESRHPDQNWEVGIGEKISATLNLAASPSRMDTKEDSYQAQKRRTSVFLIVISPILALLTPFAVLIKPQGLISFSNLFRLRINLGIVRWLGSLLYWMPITLTIAASLSRGASQLRWIAFVLCFVGLFLAYLPNHFWKWLLSQRKQSKLIGTLLIGLLALILLVVEKYWYQSFSFGEYLSKSAAFLLLLVYPFVVPLVFLERLGIAEDGNPDFIEKFGSIPIITGIAFGMILLGANTYWVDTALRPLTTRAPEYQGLFSAMTWFVSLCLVCIEVLGIPLLIVFLLENLSKRVSTSSKKDLPQSASLKVSQTAIRLFAIVGLLLYVGLLHSLVI